jgi:hypothetical protein
MLVGQFKELNRNLQEVIYSQKITIGLKKTLELIIFLATLIYMGTMKSLWTLPEKIMAGNSYEFEELEGRTLAELEGLGVISRFDDLISKFGTATFVKFNVGTTHVFASI